MVSGADLFISLFNNLAIFILTVAVYGFLNSYLHNSTAPRRQLMLGLAFGLFTIGCMYVKIPVAPGVIVDQRNTIVTLSGAFGGPLSALICATMASAYRAYLGGEGVLGGVTGVCLSATAGIIIYKLRARIDTIIKAVFTALAAAIFILPGFLPIRDLQYGWNLMKAMAMPYGMAIFVGMLFVGLLLAHEERRYTAESERKKSEKRYRELFENLIDLSYKCDSDGKIILISPSVKKMLGYDPEEVIGKTTGHFYRDAEEYDRFGAQIRRDGLTENFKAEIRRKDGSFIWVSTNAKLLTSEDGTVIGIEGISRDISKQKTAEAEKLKLEEQLRQSQKMEAIGTLASGVAHDFNNLLQAISGYTELMRSDKKTSTSSQSHISQINIAVDRAAELVRRLLTFSRKKEVDLSPIDLNQEVKLVVKLLKRTIPPMISVETHLDPDAWPVLGDATQFEQVLMNLGVNARDAMPHGGLLTMETSNFTMDEVFAALHLGAKPGQYVHLAVSDNGIGMDKETSQRMFEPFFTSKSPGKGTGLGLFTVYGIIKEMGGFISCYSEPGQGTVFNLYLPALQQKGKSAGTVWKEPDYSMLEGAETILLVDDEPAIRELGSTFLSEYGYQVETASSGEEALEAFQQRREEIDLVILDLGMPGMGGYNALQKIVELDPKAKVIIASGYSRQAQHKDAAESGVSGYIAKPFKMVELIKTVRGVLDNSASHSVM